MTDQRTKEYLARSRGQTVNYLPEDVVIVTDPDHPCYDERANDPIEQEMVDDVFELGVHTPPIVKIYTNNKGKKFPAVVAGRRRFKAATLANKRRVAEGLEPRVVECKLRNDLTDEEVRAIIVSENEQRKEDSLKNKIAKASRMYKAAEEAAAAEGEKFDSKATLARLAVNFGTTALTIKRWIEVPKLGAAARGAIFKGTVPLGAVDSLKNMSAAVQAEAVKTIAASGATGTKGARKATEDKPQSRPEVQPRRSRKAIEAKITEWEKKFQEGGPHQKTICTAVLDGLRFCLGQDTL